MDVLFNVNRLKKIHFLMCIYQKSTHKSINKKLLDVKLGSKNAFCQELFVSIHPLTRVQEVQCIQSLYIS